jgi:hypothetical protein
MEDEDDSHDCKGFTTCGETSQLRAHSFFSMGRKQIPSFLSKDHDLYSQLQTSSQTYFLRRFRDANAAATARAADGDRRDSI